MSVCIFYSPAAFFLQGYCCCSAYSYARFALGAAAAALFHQLFMYEPYYVREAGINSLFVGKVASMREKEREREMVSVCAIFQDSPHAKNTMEKMKKEKRERQLEIVRYMYMCTCKYVDCTCII